LAYEFLNRDKNWTSSTVGRLVLIILPLLVYIIFRQSLFGNFASAVLENTGELKLRLLALAGTIVMYAGLIVWPTDLHDYRSMDILAPYGFSWLTLAVVIVLILIVARRLSFEERRWASFGLIWFLASLAPVLNIIPLVNEYSFVAAAEHNLYFPIIGFIFFGCVVIRYYGSRAHSSRSEWLALVLVIVIVLLGLSTVKQNDFWKDEITLFKRSLEFQLGRVRILLAKAYFKEGRMDDAIHEYQLAGQIMQRYSQKATTTKAKRFYDGMIKGICSDSAQAYAFKKDFKRSIEHYDRALRIDPQDSFLYSNRALSLIGFGDIDSGMKDLEKALVLNENNLLAANNLSICYIQKGDFGKAKELLNSILAKDPGFRAARDNLDQLKRAQAIKP
jgi:tetratricopeptide (TPR) repeat protein